MEPSFHIALQLGAGLDADILCHLLAAVEQSGSLQGAARQTGHSYRFAWGLVRRAEAQLGQALLRRQAGGRDGGGASLTAAGADLLRRYQRFRSVVAAAAVQIFEPADAAQGDEWLRPHLLLASTITPVEVGLVPALAAAFLRDQGIAVRYIAAGSGQALAIGRSGRVDLLLTHSPAEEEAFVAAGYGTGRIPCMSNDFVLVGPAADPANVRRASSAAEALRRIAAAGAPFRTRGDGSGTHRREQALWARAGVAPGPPWYRADAHGALGSAALLRRAEDEQAYTLVDRATYVTHKPGLELALLYQDAAELQNPFCLIPVHPERFPAVQHEAALAFCRWVTGPDGRSIIERFGLDRYGRPLFTTISWSTGIQGSSREL